MLTDAVLCFQNGGTTRQPNPSLRYARQNIRGIKPPGLYLRAIALQQKKGNSASLEAALRSVIIPKVDFNDVSVREAIGYVAQRVKEISNGNLILNVVWIVPAENDYRVTLSLQQVRPPK